MLNMNYDDKFRRKSSDRLPKQKVYLVVKFGEEPRIEAVYRTRDKGLDHVMTTCVRAAYAAGFKNDVDTIKQLYTKYAVIEKTIRG